MLNSITEDSLSFKCLKIGCPKVIPFEHSIPHLVLIGKNNSVNQKCIPAVV